MLTKRQRECLTFIDGHTADTGTPPTLTEIAKALRLSRKSGAQRLVKGLVCRGFLFRVPYQHALKRIYREQFFRFNDETKTLDRWG